jgi:hypothetical protein
MSAHRVLKDLFRAFEANGPGVLNDPGDAGSIEPTMWGQQCLITTAAAETRTLARPAKAGILCSVVLDTDVGDMTLTVTGGYNADADTSITFADAGDMVVFLSVKTGTTYQWTAIAQEGTNAAVETLDVDSLSIGGLSVLLQDLPTTAGVGVTGAADNFASKVEKIGTLFKTTIVIDVDGLNSGGTADDVIGADGSGVAHLGQITAARNGTIFAGLLTCIETPTGGDPDIDLHSATEATGVEDTAISALTETKLCNSGDLTSASRIPLTAFPAANEYLYLTSGDATAATYTAGIVLIELWGK